MSFAMPWHLASLAEATVCLMVSFGNYLYHRTSVRHSLSFVASSEPFVAFPRTHGPLKTYHGLHLRASPTRNWTWLLPSPSFHPCCSCPCLSPSSCSCSTFSVCPGPRLPLGSFSSGFVQDCLEDNGTDGFSVRNAQMLAVGASSSKLTRASSR